MSSGETNLNSKLTTEQIVEIRTRYAAGGIRQIDLARKFGVGQSHISRIIRSESWGHGGT